jgi:hypothetical protein
MKNQLDTIKNYPQHGIATIAGLVQVSGSLPRLGFCHGGKGRSPQIRYCGYTRTVGVHAIGEVQNQKGG